MNPAYVVAVEGISALDALDELKPAVRKAAMRAVNYAVKRARTESGRRMRQQSNWTASYLTGANGKLVLGSLASENDLEATITGRFRPTSLARFIVGSPTPGKAGVRVEVNPGDSKLMKRAFALRLPQGSTLTETKFNLGLAIRLRPGETIQNKHKLVQISKGLFLMYGPSVDQVFSDVAVEVLPDVDAWLQQEFDRLIKVGDF